LYYFLPDLRLSLATRSTMNPLTEKTNEQFYLRIKDEDLIERKFRYHRHCYRNFIRTKAKPTEATATTNEKGDYDDVCKCVDEDIIYRDRCIV